MGATFSIVANTARIAAVSPTISSKRYFAAASARNAALSASARSRARRSPRSSSARATFSRTTSGANGFCRKSQAPSRIASTAVSTVPKAVTIITGQSGSRSRTAFTTSSPPIPSILRSVITNSTGGRPAAGAMCVNPSAPDDAITASCPMRRTVAPNPSRIVSLSSMMRIRAIRLIVPSC